LKKKKNGERSLGWENFQREKKEEKERGRTPGKGKGRKDSLSRTLTSDVDEPLGMGASRETRKEGCVLCLLGKRGVKEASEREEPLGGNVEGVQRKKKKAASG